MSLAVLEKLKNDLKLVFDCRVTFCKDELEQGVIFCRIGKTTSQGELKAKVTGSLSVICEKQEIGAFWFYKRHSSKESKLTKNFIFSRDETLESHFGANSLFEAEVEFTYLYQEEYNKQTEKIETVIFE
jgi:hypothetical protein